MTTTTETLRIIKFSPLQMWGFLEASEGDVYFHLSTFDPGSWVNPPPIVGEEVEATWDDAPNLRNGKAPRASRVLRLRAPCLELGVVSTFNVDRGFGFVSHEAGDIFLHRSEVLNGRLPTSGDRVSYYMGARKGQPRALYVEVQ